MVNFYDIIKNYNELHGEEQIKKYSFIKQKLKELNYIDVDDENLEILDVAHGTGIIKKVFFQKNILGIDNSKNLLEQSECKTLFYDFNNIPFPFKSKEFDLLLCVTAFHHSNNFLKLAKEFKRLSNVIVVSLLKKSKTLEEQKKVLEEIFKDCNFDFFEHEIDVIFIAKCK